VLQVVDIHGEEKPIQQSVVQIRGCLIERVDHIMFGTPNENAGKIIPAFATFCGSGVG
jgi:hypothetical protein